MSSTDIAVLGAGSYGTSLAIALARNGHSVCLWGHNPEHIATIAKQRSNERFLPGIEFPETLTLSDDIAQVAHSTKNILVVVPSHVFAEVLQKLQPHLQADTQITWATKGLEPETGRLLQDVATEILGNHYSLAVLSGPTFAKELAAGLPTAIAVASENEAHAAKIAELLRCESRLRVYQNNDFTGLQLGGAIKNVIAIGAGMSDGLGFGANARTALITRGLVEMSRLGEAVGAKANTFIGMSGLGDLVLTCTDNQSRNRRFGLALGQGQGIEQAQTDIGQVVEGYRNTKEVFVLAQRLGVEMPITEQIYKVLYKGKPAIDAAKSLLSRQPKLEY